MARKRTYGREALKYQYYMAGVSGDVTTGILAAAEGPGIDIIANVIGLGLDSILLVHADGAPASEYPFTEAGFISALGAAVSGDIVLLPAGTIAVTGSEAFGSPIASGAIVPTSESGVEITGLVVGNYYAIQSTGSWAWTTTPIYSAKLTTHYNLRISSSWEAGSSWWDENVYPIGHWYDDDDWPAMTLPSWASEIDCVANCGGTNRNKTYRITWQATTTSIFIRAEDDIYWDNSGTFGYALYSVTLSADVVVPSGVEVVGLGKNSVIDGNITNNGKVTDLTITGSIYGVGEYLFYNTGGKLITNRQIEIDIETGTSPLNVESTTLNTNLNADLLDGHHWSESNNSGNSGYGDYILSTFDYDDDTTLFILSSSDGINWVPIGTQPNYYISSGQLRDPSITKVNAKYFIAHTYGTGPGWAEGSSLRILESDDLITWTIAATVELSGMGADYVWAPEWFIDDDGSVHIFVSISINNGSTFQIYEIHPTDETMTAWSTPVMVTWTGTQPTTVIDPYVVKIGGVYYLWYKEEGADYVEYASSTSLTSGYTTLESGDWAGWGTFEGPCLVRLYNGNWRLYVDHAGEVQSIYYMDSADDWATWTAPAKIQPEIYNHGTVIRRMTLAHGVLQGLLNDDHTQYLTETRHDQTERHELGTVVPHDDLENLNDVVITSPNDGETLVYDSGEWVNGASQSGGKYRQFVYIVSGGDFSFVIDDNGYPVMALQELE